MGQRLVGRLIDGVIAVGVGIVVVLPDEDPFGFSWWEMLAAVLLFGWEVLWLLRRNATLGKMLVEAEVHYRDGREPLTLVVAALRSSPRLLYGFPLGVAAALPFGLVSLILMVRDDRRRSLADRLARTGVHRAGGAFGNDGQP